MVMLTAFVARKGSGKSEACKYIESIDPSAVRVNFKDALVAEIRECMPDVLRELSQLYTMSVDELFSQKPPAARALLQNFGTELRREFDRRPDYWVMKWAEVARAEIKQGNHVLVDDCRFLNEADMVRELGGKIVKIVRDDIPANDGHRSETEMMEIECDTIIYTSKGDFDTFFASIDDFLSSSESFD
jgi:hypothetical protein